MATFSYCESVTATSTGPWHIRRLTDVGQKFGGGIDTPSLCGRVTNGWDLRVRIHARQPEFVCLECWELMRLDTTEATYVGGE